MRHLTRRASALIAALALVGIGTVPVAADTLPGGDDLGLEAVAVTGGSIDRTGAATVSGYIVCSQDLEAFVLVDLAQVVGRTTTLRGWAETSVECDAAAGTAAFTTDPFYADSGKFAPGRARASAFAFVTVCDAEDNCTADSEQSGVTQIRLRRA